MATLFLCPKCKRRFRKEIKIMPFHCSCGNKLEKINYVFNIGTNSHKQQPATQSAAQANDLPCVYRGEVTGDLNCGCAGKPKVYACEKHGSCALRKLKPGKYDVTFCNGCEDRRYYKPNKIGLLLTCFNAVGGVETWARILVDNVLPGSISGIATGVEAKGIANVPVYSGEDAVAELMDASDMLLVWGISELPKEIKKTKPCYAVHHGSLASTWANEVFEKQLVLCDGGIAINQEVAEKYGVKYLPNPIIEIDKPNKVQHEGTNILWNHRWATEKRANLMLDIAKLLPNDCKMLVSAPKQIELPANCVNIGQNPDNQKWFDKTDIFLSTASQEAFGYSIAEAVLAEIPVVATPYGIAKDFAVECVDSDDPAVWVQAIMNAKAGLHDLRAKKQQILDQFGPNCHKKWQDFLAALKTV